MTKGIYCLVFSIRKNLNLKIGRSRKSHKFPKGFYCYVGSGMNNLEARINRHMSKGKNKFWHIDYLLDYADMLAVKTIKTNKKMECKISKMLEKFGKQPAKGFGSSDCKCNSHLHHFKENPLADERFLSVFYRQ